MSRFRNVCVTFNNYPESFTPEVFNEECKYYVIGKEIGEKGTKHLQCYMEFKKQKRLKSIQLLFKAKVHVEARKGTPQEASDYCKKDGDFIEHGTISAQGRRNDIKRPRS